MNYKKLYYGLGFLTFILTLITYLLTAQPSTPFWDCGEFSAAAIYQQVPHPPGSPLFLMAGKVLHALIPFGDENWRINLLSVLATTFSCFLLYFIIIKVIQNFRDSEIKDIGEAIAIYGSAFIGAMAYCWSDTLWFNGVESEVYASTTLLTALVIYLMMRWNEVADQPHNERYLFLIFYLIVLSSGVHLLAILTIFSIVMLVYFRKYEFKLKSFLIMGLIALITFFVIYEFIIMWIPTFLAGNLPFKNAAREYLVEGEPLVVILFFAFIALMIYGWFYTNKRNMLIPKLIISAFLLMIIAYTVNFHIIIRANANPPMNENEPSSFKRLVSYLGREQYGESKYWPRRFEYRDDSKIQYYEKYGKWYPPEPVLVTKKDGKQTYDYVFKKINTAGELNYLFNYQIYHMFIRYFLWNFVGRTSDVQDAGVTFIDTKDAKIWNFKSGYEADFPVRFFAIPLVFGLLGLFFHFWKDPKMAFVYLIMFLLMGVLAAIAQNQLERQPRERDYFYTGAFLVFCLWIGLGAYSLVEKLLTKEGKTRIISIVLIISFLIVPINMAVGGWRIHSRAGNYLPFDFAYNLLQSCEKDAILFTVGDNDTFPLWNIQDALGVRRDVRVVNLSLGGTRWYINQLKNRSPWGAKPIPLSFSDASINPHIPDDSDSALNYTVNEGPIEIKVKVPKDILAKFTSDTNIINSEMFTLNFYGDKIDENKYLYHLSHQLIIDIIKNCIKDRPIYFSATVGSDVFRYGIDNYLRYEGMAYRLLPVPANKSKTGLYNEEVMDACLLTNVDNTNNYHTKPHYGFKFRNLNNLDVYYDEVHRRYLDSYRQIYLNYVNFLIGADKKEKALQILNKMNECISTVQFPLMYDEEILIAKLYLDLGQRDKAKEFAQMCLKTCNEILNEPKLRRERVHSLYYEATGRMGPGVYKSAASAYAILGDYNNAVQMLLRLFDITKDFFNSIAGRQDRSREAERVNQNMSEIFFSIQSFELEKIDSITAKYGQKAGIDSLKATIKKYAENQDPILQHLKSRLEERLSAMESETEQKQKPNQKPKQKAM